MTEPVPRSLHEHDFNRLLSDITALDRVLTERMDAIDRYHTGLGQERDRAVDIALQAAKEKAQAHNELLAQMKDQQATFCTKEQAELQSKMLSSKIEALEKHHIADMTKDKTIGMSANLIMQLLVAASVVISIVVFFANWQTAK